MKVKARTETDKEKEFQRDLAYEEFVLANNPESSSCEDDTENVFCKAKILKPHNYLYPLNNLHYQPLQGA